MLNVFQADLSDLKWMYRLLINTSNKGHFLLDNTQQGREGLKYNLHSIVVRNQRLDEELQTQTMVFKDEQGHKVGFVVMSEIENGYGNEIYAFIVDKAYRGKGYGRYMLNEIIQRWHADSAIYARCHAVSKLMRGMLQNSGFVCDRHLEDGADLYRLDKQQGGHILISPSIPNSTGTLY